MAKDYLVGEFNSWSNTENLLNSIMSQSKILLQPKKSAFSKSLIVMMCFKYLICVLLNTEYWTAKAWLKTRRKDKNYLATPS